MILVGLEDCPTCKIAKSILPTLEYICLPKNSKGPSEPLIREIKLALGRLNPTGHFPVVLTDDKTKIATTDVLLDNLNIEKLQRLLET